VIIYVNDDLLPRAAAGAVLFPLLHFCEIDPLSTMLSLPDEFALS
jgi:hypothetical protein